MRRWVVAVVALCGCNTAFGLDPTELVNNNPRAIVFDNRASATDIIDLPVPIRLDPSRIEYAEVADPNVDLRFHDPVSNADLPFEVEEWIPGATSTVWVKVPLVPARTIDTTILMYYGELARGAGQDPGALWSDWALVVHGIPGSTYQSVPSSITGTPTDVQAIDGPVAKAMKLGGAGVHRISYAGTRQLFVGWPMFTVELWIYADYANGFLPNEPRIISQNRPLTNGRLFPLPNNPQENYVDVQIDFQFFGGTSTDPMFMPLRRWVHMVYRYDGETLWQYRNGALANIVPIGGTSGINSPTEELVLGTSPNATTGGLEGALDEVRISPHVQSDDWIAAEFLAMNGGFVTFATPGDL